MSSTITINSNISSLQTQRRLGESSQALNQVFQRLSSGQRISRASDDAAGLAISDSLRVDRRVYSQGVRNLNDGISLLSIGEGALSELTSIVTRCRELAEQAANGTLGNRQRTALDKEAQQLSKEYVRIAQSTEFNGIKIFNGSTSTIRLQAGYESAGGVVASVGGTKGTGQFNTEVASGITVDCFQTAVGDLNGDGFADIVTSGYNGAIYSQIGRGDGTFLPIVTLTNFGGTIYDVTLGDVNGDGIADIAGAGYSGAFGGPVVLLGNGNGTFKTATSYFVSGVGEGVQLADVNGDGSLDLLTALSGTILVQMNNGRGQFGSASSYSTGQADFKISVGDINGDGISDLATFGVSGGGQAAVRLGNGNGTFNNSTIYQMDSTMTRSGVLADINSDGKLDLISGGLTGATATIAVRLGTGVGSFGALATFASGLSNTLSILVSDMNGDGTQDVVCSGDDLGEGQISQLFGLGNGSFGEPILALPGLLNSNYGVSVGDVNGDGVLDLATAGENGSTIILAKPSEGVGALLPFSLKDRYGALQAMADLDRSLKRISSHRGYLGAFQSRVDSALKTVQNTIENYAAAESQIRDADVANESANLAKGTILQRAGAAVLSQANQEPQIALSLLREL